MPAKYVDILQDELEEYLSVQDFKRIKVPGVVELVYGKRVDMDGMQLTLRIYSGIEPNGHSRERGKDAIRVTVWWRNDDGVVYMIGGSKRVHRVEGWRMNLQNRIDLWENELLGPKCKYCGRPTVERNGKNGKFFGCVEYKECNITRSKLVNNT